MTTPHTGLILSPFDKRWRSGIDWESLNPSKPAKNVIHAQPPGFKTPKLTERKTAQIAAPKPAPEPKKERRPQSQSTTASIRRLLADRGPMTRREIASALDIVSAHVPGLLQHDIAIGRVRKNISAAPIQFVLIGPAE